MKALVMWARDHYPEPYSLNIRSRTPETIAGFVKMGGEWRPFSYDRKTRVITVGEGEDARRIVINEWGWEQ